MAINFFVKNTYVRPFFLICERGLGEAEIEGGGGGGAGNEANTDSLVSTVTLAVFEHTAMSWFSARDTLQ